MRIKDVIISEAPAAAPAPATKTGTGASGFPVNQPGVPANQRPNMVRDPRLLTNIDGGAGAIAGAQAGKVTTKKATPASGKIPAQPTLNGQPSTGPKGQEWLTKYGATHNPDGTPKAAVDQAAVPASANASSSYTGAPAAAQAAEPAAQPATPSAGTTAEIDRLKQLAIGGQQPAAQAAQAAEPAAAEPAANPGTGAGGIAFNQGSLGTRAPEPQAEPAAGQRPGGIAFNQDAGTTSGQAAQAAPAPEAPAPAAAPAAPSTVAPVVKTGTGGTLTTRDGKPVTSRSDDEIAWAQKNPYQPYPGPGWQEKQNAQGDQNAAAVKGFLNKINPFAKKAAPAAPGTSAAPAAFNQGAPVTMETKRGDDELLEKMRTIAGLR